MKRFPSYGREEHYGSMGGFYHPATAESRAERQRVALRRGERMAIPGLYLNEKKVRPIEAHRPTLTRQELESVLNCLIEDRLGQGDITRRFERAFANAFGYKHVLAVNSLAAAYHLAYLALEMQPGDPVVVSALAPIQACDALRYCGGRPVVVDAARGSFHPDSEALLQKLREARGPGEAQLENVEDGSSVAVDEASTEASAATPEARQAFYVYEHSFGSPSTAPIQEIAALGVKMVEDFTGLVGSERNGEYFGRSAPIGVCGLSEYDLLTTGNGAVIVTQDPKLFKKLQGMRYGVRRNATELAFDYRLEDFQAAMGLDQLSRLGITLARRKKIGQKYLETLRTTRHETYFKEPGVDAYLHFPVLVNKASEEVQRYFSSLQIGVSKALDPPVHHALGLPRLEFPNAERMYQKGVCVPIYPALTANNVERIASSLRGLI